MFDNKQFGKRVRYFRENKGLTLEKLSELADIDSSHLANIEYGKTKPSTRVIISILNAFKITYSALVGSEDIDALQTKLLLDEISQLDDNEVKFAKFVLNKIKE